MRSKKGNLMIEYSIALALSAVLFILCEKAIMAQLKVSSEVTNKEFLAERIILLHQVLKNELKCNNEQMQFTVHKKDHSDHDSMTVLCKKNGGVYHEKKLYLQEGKICKLYMKTHDKTARSILNGVCSWEINSTKDKEHNKIILHPKICLHDRKKCIETKMVFSI